MKTYLEIKVPIRYDAPWFKKLRCIMKDVPVKWQQGYYHITMAFVDDTPKGVDLRPILENQFNGMLSPEMSFDKIDAFEATSGMDIIYLGVSVIPDNFKSSVSKIREDLKNAGCIMQSDFKLHVTLGRVVEPKIKLETLQQLTQSASLPSFTLKLSEIEYRVFRGETIYKTRLN